MTYSNALPDPVQVPEIYADTPIKRLIAWLIDTILIAILTAVVVPFTAFIGLFFLPALFAVLSFLYRWVTLARGSATLGMRFVAISLRRADGSVFDGTTAFLHTTGYFVSVLIFPLQLVSVALMLITPRRQGLTDHILGTVAVNRTART